MVFPKAKFSFCKIKCQLEFPLDVATKRSSLSSPAWSRGQLFSQHAMYLCWNYQAFLDNSLPLRKSMTNYPRFNTQSTVFDRSKSQGTFFMIEPSKNEMEWAKFSRFN